jgi:hypothetical protein
MREDDFLAQLKTMTADRYWAGLERCGWLAELRATTAATLKQRINRAFVARDFLERAHVYYALATVVFDSECIQDQGPSEGEGEHCYYDVITLLAQHSHGAFKPTNIHDRLELDQGKASIAFDHGNHHYERTLAQPSDWIDVSVVDVVNQALADIQARGRFIALPACDQLIYLVFSSEPIYQCIITAGLIPEGDVFDPPR